MAHQRSEKEAIQELKGRLEDKSIAEMHNVEDVPYFEYCLWFPDSDMTIFFHFGTQLFTFTLHGNNIFKFSFDDHTEIIEDIHNLIAKS